ncbi:hypothetical protein IQ06DRAFT_281689 [Phaeosphaeriaceae sp. SRC1lsM3a]|nr:hypothetical protein IQ06DRAFT_281689 [Stagonospora sp. SRC1lsM3a]
MTAPLRSTPHASALPASQTAPVAEFRCLFTHDVRRKQKRWQDGFLKFHTFNNRVMVCDEARNHIGDTYWKESNELHEGDELSLDKGVLVEVAEAMGITQTNLAPIINAKNTKEPPKDAVPRPAPSATARPFQRPTSVAPNTAARGASQLRHRSLNTLLGTPKGPVGKAVPMKSPYEARKEKENADHVVEERAPKRQRVDQRPTAWRASSPVHIDEPSPIKPPPLWARTANATARQTSGGLSAQPSKTVTISLESDPPPPISSGVTLPSTPARAIEPMTPRPLSTSTAFSRPDGLAKSVPVPVPKPKPPPAKVRLPKKKTAETPQRPAPTSSPPVSASNRLTNIDFALKPAPDPPKILSPPRSPPKPKAKSLRLSTGVKRATLLCQSMPRSSSRMGREPTASYAKSVTTKPSRRASKEPSPTIREQEEEDVGHGVGPSRNSPALNKKQKPPDVGMSRSKKAKERTPPLEPQQGALDDPEIMYGLMDQQLLFLSSPEAVSLSRVSPPTTVPPSKAKTKAKTSKKPAVDAVDVDFADSTRPASKRAWKASPVAETVQAVPPPRTVFDHPVPRFKDISPRHNCPSDLASRLASTSKNPELELLAARPETVALPPHPLRATRKGPMLSTTELASVLSKSKKRAPVHDPIEDDGELPTKSPARKMRRVRSENDAPIPSTAGDWEKRNLPRASSKLTEPEVDVEHVAQPEPKKKVSALAALVKRTDPRKKFQRTQSLNVDTTVMAVVEPELPSPVIDRDVGPWSTEAFDLFDWRPPAREEEGD